MRRVSAIAAIALVGSLSPIVGGGGPVAAATTPPPDCVHLRLEVRAPVVRAGDASMVIVAVNEGGRCRLRGAPTVAFGDVAGRVLAGHDHYESSSAFAWRTPRLLTVAHAAAASFGISWRAPTAGERCPTATWLGVSLPHGVGAIHGGVDVHVSTCGAFIWVTALGAGEAPPTS